MSASDFEFPLTVTFVQLCDGTTGYIPGEELLSELEGPYYILNQFDIDADDLITILVTIKRPLFSMHFSDHQENGNIAEMRWKVTDRSVKQYDFTYDPLNRMTSANYGYYAVSPVPPNAPPGSQPIPSFVASEEYSVITANYDAVGNLTGIIRNGMVPGVECLEPTEIDDLTLKYDGQTNHLLYSFDNAPIGGRSHGFKPGGGGNGSGLPPYSYDDNGNLTHDPHKSISISSYNFLNLPEQIGNMQITYDATGRKWEKKGEGNVKTEYISGIEYRDNNLEAIYLPDGRIVYDHVGDEYRTEYFRQDHLGNNRLTFCDFNNNGIIEISDDPNTPTNELEITQETHYYPFGMEQNGNWYATVAPDNNYLYNGKELNRDYDINLYDYGARWYDPAIGRWNAVDPSAENYYGWSPYHYAANNPARVVDLDGRDWYIDKDNNISWFESGDETYTSDDGVEYQNIGTELLTFDGKNLTYSWQEGNEEDGYTINSVSFKAISGRGDHAKDNYWRITKEFDYSDKSQTNSFAGPIPEGVYSVNKDEVQYIGDQSLLKQAVNHFGRGGFPGGRFSWGNNRWWINSEGDTETYGRGGFTIHGGKKYGSAGCIDLCDNLGSFTKKFMNNNLGNSKVYLNVSYDIEKLKTVVYPKQK